MSNIIILYGTNVTFGNPNIHGLLLLWLLFDNLAILFPLKHFSLCTIRVKLPDLKSKKYNFTLAVSPTCHSNNNMGTYQNLWQEVEFFEVGVSSSLKFWLVPYSFTDKNFYFLRDMNYYPLLLVKTRVLTDKKRCIWQWYEPIMECAQAG